MRGTSEFQRRGGRISLAANGKIVLHLRVCNSDHPTLAALPLHPHRSQRHTYVIWFPFSDKFQPSKMQSFKGSLLMWSENALPRPLNLFLLVTSLNPES